MPIMNELTATELIRKINPAVPIIAQTAHATQEDRKRLAESDFNNVLVKPISPKVLVIP